MKMRVAVEFELNVDLRNHREDNLDDFLETFCKDLVEWTDEWYKEEHIPISLKYLDHAYTTNGTPILEGNDDEDNN